MTVVIGSRLGIHQQVSKVAMRVFAITVVAALVGVIVLRPIDADHEPIAEAPEVSSSSASSALDLNPSNGRPQPPRRTSLELENQESRLGENGGSAAEWWQDDDRFDSYLAAYSAAIKAPIPLVQANAPGPSQLELLQELEKEWIGSGDQYFQRIHWEELGEIEFHDQAQFIRVRLEGIKELVPVDEESFERSIQRLDRAPFQFTPESAVSALIGNEVVLSDGQQRELDLLFWRALGSRAAAEPDLRRFEYANLRGLRSVGTKERFPFDWEFAPSDLLDVRERCTKIEHGYLDALESFIFQHGL